MNHNIIAFTGPMHAGKSECTKALAEILTKKGYHVKTIKFADPLYEIQREVYRITGLEEPVKDRQLLQYIGTDWGRSKSETIWTDIWRKAVRTYLFKHTESQQGVVLCDDCRFDNEAALVKEMRGIVIGVQAHPLEREKRSPKTFSGTSHASENGVSENLIDATIYNNEGLYELRQQLRYMVEDRIL